MTRITHGRLKIVMAKTGATLVQGITFDEEHRAGCPIGILAHSKRTHVNRPDVCAKIDITEDYAKGMIDGFDELEPHWFEGQFDGYKLGYADGRAIAKAEFRRGGLPAVR